MKLCESEALERTCVNGFCETARYAQTFCFHVLFFTRDTLALLCAAMALSDSLLRKISETIPRLRL